jgi:hypothetical protein
MQVAILHLRDRSAWEAAHRLGGLPGQSWTYAASLALSGFDLRLAIAESDEGRLLLPFVERSWRGHVDIATPSGLSGASVQGSSRIWHGWRAYAREQGWIAGYVQLGVRSASDADADPCDRVRRGSVFCIDPRRWTLSESTSTIIRRKVSASERAGVHLVLDRAELAARLPALYAETMDRFNAPARFTTETIHHWVGDPANVAIGVAAGSSIELIHLILQSGAYAELHLVGTTAAGRAHSAYAYVKAIELLRVRGVSHYNLGGGGEPGDGLYMFKRWLGASPSPLHVLHQVYAPDIYAALCHEAGTDGGTDWFPGYRSPASW